MEQTTTTNEQKYIFIQDGANLPFAFYKDTPQEVIDTILRARASKTRVKFMFGDLQTGQSWHEENDTCGYIGMSKGHSARYPILLHNSKSIGGGTILTHCILKISESKGGRILYQHGNFTPSKFEICPSDFQGYSFEVHINGELYSRHKTKAQAERLIKKLS
jgi:hypothetical protein